MRNILRNRTAVLALIIAGGCLTPAVFLSTSPAEAQQIVQRDPRVIASLDTWGYDQIYRQGWSANRLLDDARVYGQLGEEIGSVENLILSREGQILGIIAQVGGFWDIGDTHVFVPWDRVTVSPTLERVYIPVTEENIEEYVARPSYITRALTQRVRPVDDSLRTGFGLWKATDLINDYVYLGDRVEYGYVNDLIFNANGQLYAYVVNADANWGGGYYALPYARSVDWDPALGYYDAPFAQQEVRRLEPFDYNRMSERVAMRTGAATGVAEGRRERGEVVGTVNRNVQPRQTTAIWSYRDVDRDRNLELADTEFVRVGREIFSRWDRNRDDRLTPNEFYAGAFGVFDRDRDDRISEREFSRMWDRWGRGFDRQVAFIDLDRDGDGFLAENEFRRGLNRVGYYDWWAGGVGGGLNERQFSQRAFRLWDADRDRIVDRREFDETAGWNWF